MIRKSLMILFMTFSNPCNAVLTRDHAHQLIDWILNDPLSAEIVFVGLLPCSRFDAFVPAFEASSTGPTQNLPKVKEDLLELFKYLLKEIKCYPKNYEAFKKESLENKRLYRVVCTVFCFLIMIKVTLETFDRATVEKDSILRKLNKLFENDIDLVPFLKLFPMVLCYFSFIRHFPAIISSSDAVDKPEPQFCHWITKAALIIVHNIKLRELFSQNPNSNRDIFVKQLVKMEKEEHPIFGKNQILNLFVYSCMEISGTDKDHSLYSDPNAVIVFNPTNTPIIEPVLECSELEKFLTEEPKKRRKKRKPTGKRAPISTVQPTFLDEEQGMTPSSTASSSPYENNHWDGPLLDLDQTWRTEGSRKLVGMTDNKEKLKVLKRSHSAPPITKTTRESF